MLKAFIDTQRLANTDKQVYINNNSALTTMVNFAQVDPKLHHVSRCPSIRACHAGAYVAHGAMRVKKRC